MGVERGNTRQRSDDVGNGGKEREMEGIYRELMARTTWPFDVYFHVVHARMHTRHCLCQTQK